MHRKHICAYDFVWVWSNLLSLAFHTIFGPNARLSVSMLSGWGGERVAEPARNHSISKMRPYSIAMLHNVIDPRYSPCNTHLESNIETIKRSDLRPVCIIWLIVGLFCRHPFAHARCHLFWFAHIQMYTSQMLALVIGENSKWKCHSLALVLSNEVVFGSLLLQSIF